MSQSRLTLANPATYYIRIQGFLGKRWSEHLGMTIEQKCDANGQPVTNITGRLVDQAALYGLLDFLYNLGFPLLAVECLQVEEIE